MQRENAKTVADGVTTLWKPANFAADHEIEGYASATSVNRGGSIKFYVNTIDQNYAISVYRIGWYGGNGGREMLKPVVLPGVRQPACPKLPVQVYDVGTGTTRNDPANYLLECNWSASYTLTIPNSADPTDWASGVYLAKLKGDSNKESNIVFVVRDDSRQSSIVFQSAFTTYAAYDNWGQETVSATSPNPGKSLYNFTSTNGQRAYKVSLNRPFARYFGTGEFLFHEVLMVRFLEKEGYDVTYQTNVDVHTGGVANLKRQKLFMMAGHDEYWTKAIRDNLEAARDEGVNLAFFGANNGYQQIRLEPSSDGSANRTVTSYKDASLDPDKGPESTSRFRDAQVNRPEASLFGAMYQYDPVDWFVQIKDVDCPAWLCAGVPFVNNRIVLPGLLGHEIDRAGPTRPAGTKIVGDSPFCYTFDPGGKKVALKWTADGLPVNGVRTSNNVDDCLPNDPNLQVAQDGGFNGHMTYYQTLPSTQAPLGAEVFSTGTMFWSHGLGSWNGVRADRQNVHAQQITRNILNRFSGANPLLVATGPTQRLETTGGQSNTLATAPGGGCATSISATSQDISLVLLLIGGIGWRYRRIAWRNVNRSKYCRAN
ncbi:MAG: N,N-dimethylformamidase beta subunit family domain-containing protein [Burkholderiales bacterium]